MKIQTENFFRSLRLISTRLLFSSTQSHSDSESTSLCSYSLMLHAYIEEATRVMVYLPSQQLPASVLSMLYVVSKIVHTSAFFVFENTSYLVQTSSVALGDSHQCGESYLEMYQQVIQCRPSLYPWILALMSTYQCVNGLKLNLSWILSFD